MPPQAKPPTLKPCPFCGAKARTIQDGKAWLVTCSSRRCSIQPFTDFKGRPSGAIAAWNRRVEGKR